jgi:hypothetical protein
MKHTRLSALGEISNSRSKLNKYCYIWALWYICLNFRFTESVLLRYSYIIPYLWDVSSNIQIIQQWEIWPLLLEDIWSYSKWPLEDIWSCSKWPLRHLVHAKRSLIFCCLQNIHGDIWSTVNINPTLLQDLSPDLSTCPICHCQNGYQSKKGYYWQYSHNTNIGPIQHYIIFMSESCNPEL